jgi:DNA topoisomerase VI subunit A
MTRRHTAEETKQAMHLIVGEMYDRIVKGEPPTMTLPVRTKNNIGFDKKLGVYKYGKKQSIEMQQASDLRNNCYEPFTSLNSSRKCSRLESPQP